MPAVRRSANTTVLTCVDTTMGTSLFPTVVTCFAGFLFLQAVKIVKDIEDRLVGKFPKSKGLPLSVEGQVHALISVSKLATLCMEIDGTVM